MYNSSGQEGGKEEMMRKTRKLCTFLAGVFLVGATANFGRIYLMQTSGRHASNNSASEIMHVKYRVARFLDLEILKLKFTKSEVQNSVWSEIFSN